MQKLRTLLILGSCLCAAIPGITQQKKETETDLLKQLSFCVCMEKGIQAFGGGDIKDISVGYVLDKMEVRGMSDKFVMPLIREHARKAVEKMVMAVKDTANTYYDRRGYNALSLDCLEYYRSRSLDSLVRSFKRSSYYNRFDDPALNSKPSIIK